MVAEATLHSSIPLMLTRCMTRFHDPQHIKAEKHDLLRDARFGLLQTAREKEHCACDGRRAKEAALSATTAPHLLRHPHFRSTPFTGLSQSSDFRLLEFMRYTVALGVMPHRATSRATGDDTSTITTWNSGV
jgi:hypothetical protein